MVATMPLLREKELVDVIEKAQISAAICDRRLDTELLAAQHRCPVLRQIMYFDEPVGGFDRDVGHGTNAIMWGTSAISIFFVFVPGPLIVIAGTAAHALFP